MPLTGAVPLHVCAQVMDAVIHDIFAATPNVEGAIRFYWCVFMVKVRDGRSFETCATTGPMLNGRSPTWSSNNAANGSAAAHVA